VRRKAAGFLDAYLPGVRRRFGVAMRSRRSWCRARERAQQSRREAVRPNRVSRAP
jgi:hypothetical protein